MPRRRLRVPQAPSKHLTLVTEPSPQILAHSKSLSKVGWLPAQVQSSLPFAVYQNFGLICYCQIYCQIIVMSEQVEIS